jgi:hypothetical protein
MRRKGYYPVSREELDQKLMEEYWKEYWKKKGYEVGK